MSRKTLPSEHGEPQSMWERFNDRGWSIECKDSWDDAFILALSLAAECARNFGATPPRPGGGRDQLAKEIEALGK